MKKLLTIAAFVMAASSQAVTVKWTSDAIKFGTTSVGKNATGYLIFIGNNTLESDGYAWDDIISKSAVQDATTTSLSKINVSQAELGDSPVGNYVMYATYTNDGKTYYNVSSTTYSLTQSNLDKLINDGLALADAKFTLGSTVNDADAAGAIGGGWYLKQTTPDPQPSVPEPATGALALAGVALLFKRRRA